MGRPPRTSALSKLCLEAGLTNPEVADALSYSEGSWRVIRSGATKARLPKDKQAILAALIADKLGIPERLAMRRVRIAAKASHRTPEPVV